MLQLNMEVNMDAGFLFKTNNFGMCEVLKYEGCLNVKVKFLSSGNEYVTSSDQIKKGTVKDRLVPTICGVGYLGAKIPHVETGYVCWVSMIKRCYDKKTQEARPTYKGCTVCDEWLSFNSFYSFYLLNYKPGFHLDKDKRVKGNKVYSPETCEFISPTENLQVAFAREYELTHKDGRVVKVKNMAKFCRDNNLSPSGITKVKAGLRKYHKGWVKVILINN